MGAWPNTHVLHTKFKKTWNKDEHVFFFSEKGHQFLPNREFRCPMLILQSSNAFPWLRAGTGTAHFTFWTGSTDTLSDTETWPGWHGAPWGTRFSEVSFEMYGSLEDFGKMWYNDGKIWRNHEKSTKLWNIYYAIQINLIFCFWNWEALTPPIVLSWFLVWGLRGPSSWRLQSLKRFSNLMRFVLWIWSTPTVNAHSGTLKFFEHRSRSPSCSRLTTTWIGLAGSAVWCKPHLSCRSWMVIATVTTLVMSCLMIVILSFKFIWGYRIRVVKISPKQHILE